MFKFKQFTVDQSGCAMKINTDGVLLGAIADADDPHSILDIGTGTGVIALMLAQKFAEGTIDAVEIDANAAQTAEQNFKASPFADRLAVYHWGFETYFEQFPERKYDLIISNPPFYINSLKSPGEKKAIAKHTNSAFFERLIKSVSEHLTFKGCCLLILPINIGEMVVILAAEHKLCPQKIVNVHSYLHSEPHRIILCFSFNTVSLEMSRLTIYRAVAIYSEEYQKLLHPYFIAF